MKIHLTDAEWLLMHRLWSEGSATITELTRDLKEETGWGKHTIITMLTRLENKGAVTYREDGRAKRFSPLISQEDASCTAARQFLGKVFGGSFGLMVNAMVHQNALSQEDIDELRAILEQTKEGST